MLKMTTAKLALQTEFYTTASSAATPTPVCSALLPIHYGSFGRRLKHPVVVGGVRGGEAYDRGVKIVDGRHARKIVTLRGRLGGTWPTDTSHSHRRALPYNWAHWTGRLIYTPQILVFPLVSLAIPIVIVQGILAHPKGIVKCTLVATWALANDGTLSTSSFYTLLTTCVGPLRTSRRRTRPKSYLFLPERIGTGRIWVSIFA